MFQRLFLILNSQRGRDGPCLRSEAHEKFKGFLSTRSALLYLTCETA